MMRTSTPTKQAMAPESTVGLQAVADLFQALNREGVSYCHWKSNIRLQQALEGKTDLDLLVKRDHSEIFRRILNAYDVKPLVAAPGKHYPGIEHYLGFDRSSGELFHLHVHYRLVLGERYVKNYHLPLEAQFLDSVQLRQGVKIPAPEFELIVLSMRALFKYRDRDAVKDILSIRAQGVAPFILREVEWLLAQTSIERISQTLRGVEGIVPADVVLGFLQTARHSPRDGYGLFRLRARLRQALNSYQRHSRMRASVSYFQELWHRRKRTMGKARSRKMTRGQGQTIALIGADGAGKSTMCGLLRQWLAWKLDVQLYYMGSKQPSRRSRLLYLLFRMARRSQRSSARLLGQKSLPARWLATLRQALLYSHRLSIGHDRYRRYKESQRKASAGTLVIYDRFPVAPVLDGPKIARMTDDANTSALTRTFIRWERAIYQKMDAPDHYFLLDVSPRISMQRKPDHDRAAIETKVQELQDLARHENGRSNLVRIDANRPFEEVVARLKRAVWKIL